MGNVLIALDDETEKTLRRLAKTKYGDKKGAIQKMVIESINKVEEEEKWKRAREDLLVSMKKGYNLGMGKNGVPYANRDEIYDY